MACHRYLKDLDAFAAGRLEPQSARELQLHLHACPPCLAELEAKKHVYTTLEEGLRRRMSEELPAGFAMRVRARLSTEQEVPSPHAWSPWTAAAALASLVLGLTLVQGLWRDTSRQATGRSVPLTAKQSGQTGTVNEKPAPGSPPKAPDAIVRPVQIRRKDAHAAETTMAATPRVLVPEGQEQAVAQLIEGLRRGEVKGDVLLADRGDQVTQELWIAPLTVEPIEMEPLEDVQQEPKDSSR
jgi:anti-sigma factor RsiW